MTQCKSLPFPAVGCLTLIGSSCDACLHEALMAVADLDLRHSTEQVATSSCNQVEAVPALVLQDVDQVVPHVPS